jgi:hypothetical protein
LAYARSHICLRNPRSEQSNPQPNQSWGIQIARWRRRANGRPD